MSLIIDVVILVLLLGTLGYAFVVDRRVQKLMRALHELEPLIGDFSAAVDRSEGTVSRLKSLSQAVQAPFTHKRQPAAPRPEPEAAPRRADPAFSTVRDQPERPVKANSIPVKSDLVRGFFETVKSREA